MNPRPARNAKPLKIALTFAVVLHSIFYISFWQAFRPRPGAEVTDFIAYYSFGRAERIYDVEADRVVQERIRPGVMPMNHAPYFVPLLRLVCDEDYYASYYRWLLFVLLGVATCAFLAYRLTDSGNDSPLLAAAFVLTFSPIQVSLLGAHDTAFILLGILVWLWAIENKRSVLAGAALSLVTLKPQLALMLALPMAFHYRRAWWSFFAACLVLGAYSLILAGWQGVAGYLHIISLTAEGQSYGTYQEVMYNLRGTLIRWGVAFKTSGVIAWAAYFTALAVLCKFWRPNRAYVGVAVIVTVFFSPHLHFHDLSLLVVPALCLNSWRVVALALTSLLLHVTNVSGVGRYAVPYALMAGLSALLLLTREPRRTSVSD